MTIAIHFHQAGYRDFKHHYKNHVCIYLGQAFPGLVSYNRFVELTSGVVLQLCAYLQTRFGACTGVAFVDSTSHRKVISFAVSLLAGLIA